VGDPFVTRGASALQRVRRLADRLGLRGLSGAHAGAPSERDALAAEVARLTRALRDAQQQREALAAHARRLDDALQRLDRHVRSADYHADHLAVWHRNVGFLGDPAFVRAYRRGMDSGHKMCRPMGSTADIHIEWRVHVVCWAAWHARLLPGSFVECGVNTGVYSLAVCDFIDFNATGKDFYLFDTYRGIPESHVADADRERVARFAGLYEECYEVARRNFAPFPRARLVRGVVPESLATVDIDRVCYLSIDMNVAEPELAALAHFWDRLSPGAPVILDDYGWAEHARQYEALNRFARLHDVRIATLPTGQGLLLKP
jgi:hypothetical protein